MKGASLIAEPYTRAAAPVFEFLDHLEDFIRDGEHTLAARATAALDQFAKAAQAADLPKATIAPARYGLAVLIDQHVRQSPRVKLSTWGVLTHQRLFDGRDMSVARIRDFRRTAEEAGEDFKPLAAFLKDLINQDGRGKTVKREVKSQWGLAAAGCVTLFVLALASYAAWLEFRFHAGITEGFRQDQLTIGLDRNPTGGDLAERLTALATSVDRVSRAAALAPLRRTVRLPKFDSQYIAQTAYTDAVNTHVPPALITALEQTLATEGDALKLYDALRVWAILAGNTAWTPDYITGWMEEVETRLGWPKFSNHIAALTGPLPDLQPSDPAVMDQARAFAAETSEIDRVWLELKRGEGTRALAPWVTSAAVPGAQDVLLRRSGQPLDTPQPALFTLQGWDYARDFGIGLAVQNARILAPVILGGTVNTANDTPDQVQNRLHLETIEVWKTWLSDLRVQPFNSRDQAVLVSGTLAQRQNPLTGLLQEVWTQIGGADRRRTHAQQLKLATEFGPTIQYVESGGMDQLARVFSELNVALGSLDVDAKRGAERVMSVQSRARSINALKNAPRIVVQIAEDVLAQAGTARNEDQGNNSLTTAWQRNVYPLCRATTEGQYPFANGPDASFADVATLLSPTGALPQFFQSYASPFIDQSVSPWRWKPEARFAGLNPDSAAFFERAVTVSRALFDDGGQMREAMTLAALAERGNTVFALGGAGVPVRATGDPAKLAWPGPDPQLGVEVSFREGSEGARVALPGPWGLHRMLDNLRLRFRDGGQRVLIDIRTEEGRVFVEMGLSRPVNPVSGQQFLRDFACPPQL